MQYEAKKKRISPSEDPLVSVVTPLFEAEKYIAETISSVQSQTYGNWELIVVDDFSADASVKIVEEFSERDERIILVKNEANKGAAVCRNLATDLAKGTYIAFLDSDDLWLPTKLEKQLEFMQEHNCDVSYTSYLHIDKNSIPIKKRIKALASLSYKKQHSNNYVGNLTGIYHAGAIGKITSPDIRKRQDWGVWLEAIKRSGKPALGLQEDLALYRVHSESMSGNKFGLIAHNFRFYNKHLGHSWISSIYYLLQFFWEYFLIRPGQIEKL